jgi:hypothetical protein
LAAKHSGFTLLFEAFAIRVLQANAVDKTRRQPTGLSGARCLLDVVFLVPIYPPRKHGKNVAFVRFFVVMVKVFGGLRDYIFERNKRPTHQKHPIKPAPKTNENPPNHTTRNRCKKPIAQPCQ